MTGVGHGDEMIYLFSSSKFSMKYPHLTAPNDKATSTKIIRMWMNFVHTYNPTPNPGIPIVRLML